MKTNRFPLAGAHGQSAVTSMVKHISFICRMPLRVIFSVQLHTVIVQYPGAELEAKGMAFALHYRQAPQHEDH
ncbi:trehalose-phosphatase [Shigella flexneri]